MNTLCYTADDGTLAVVIPVANLPLSQLAAKVIPPLPSGAARPYLIVDRAALPDPMFRNAWEISGGAVGVNLPAAQALHVDRWRAFRTARLDDLDREISQVLAAGEKPATAKSLEAKRQELRDVTKTDLAGADTPDKLKALWPACLGPRPADAELMFVRRKQKP